jgi:hypothetical protein
MDLVFSGVPTSFMKRYFFFCTNLSHWVPSALKLKELGIAEPVLWIGDDKLLKDAQTAFSEDIAFSFNELRYKTARATKSADLLRKEFLHYYQSSQSIEDYCIAEKMMDRDDPYGFMSRLDKDILFKMISKFALQQLQSKHPDFLLMSDRPHSFVQYIIFRVLLYFNTPVYSLVSFNTLAPAVALLNESTDQYVKVCNSPINEHLLKRDSTHLPPIRLFLEKYIFSFVQSANSDYKPDFMIKNKSVSSFKYFLNPPVLANNACKKLIEYSSLIKSFLLREYRPECPHAIQMPIAPVIPWLRKISLSNSYYAFERKQTRQDSNIEYVYFPLHYEPERTTNPDGGKFHDQIKALLLLRSLLPDSILILVKEHPYQLMFGSKGFKGRSCLFYDLIDSIPNIQSVPIQASSTILIKNSLFVATITGVCAVEAALLSKKCIVFGTTWFQNLPNVYKWTAIEKFDEFLKKPLYELEAILNYVANFIDSYAFFGCQAPSMKRYFLDKGCDYDNLEASSTYNIFNALITDLRNDASS